MSSVKDGRSDRLGAAPERFHPREQLFQGERLCDVIVGAHLERLHLEIDRVLRREDQDGHAVAPVAQGPQDVETGERRKAQVEHQNVVLSTRRQAQPLGAVPHEIGMKAGLGQASLYVLSDRLVVLDDEDLHPMGRYTLKLDPTPTCDSTSIRPRCSAMMP